MDSVWWETSPDNDEKVLKEWFTSFELSILFGWYIVQVSLDKLSFLKGNLGIVNVDILDSSTETSYLTNEVQYRKHEKKRNKNGH